MPDGGEPGDEIESGFIIICGEQKNDAIGLPVEIFSNASIFILPGNVPDLHFDFPSLNGLLMGSVVDSKSGGGVLGKGVLDESEDEAGLPDG